jgi:hypothetical protein
MLAERANYLNRPADPPQGVGTNSMTGALGAAATYDKREDVMSVIQQPPKHLVREYLERRTREQKPPPSPEEIRRQLGWGMLSPADLKLPTPRS